MNSRTTASRKPRWLKLVSGFVGAALLATACGSDDGETASKQDGGANGAGSSEPFRVGVMAPLSGTLGSIGTNFLAGVETFLDAQNEAGGVHGRKIEVVPQDDANDPAVGIAAARSLVSDDVIAILGPPVSSMIEAVSPTTSRGSIPMLTFGASPAVLNPVQETVFQVDETSASMAQPMVDFAESLLGRKDFRVALAPVDTPSGLAWGDLISELEKDRDFQVVGKTPIPPAGGDITPQAQNIVSANPDIVLVEVGDGALVTLSQKLRDLGYDGPIVNYPFGATNNALKQAADPEVYVARTTEMYSPNSENPGTKRFVEITEAAGQVTAAESASQYASGYLIALTLTAALEECGADCDAEALTKTLSDFEVDTEGFTAKPIRFTPDDHQGVQHVRFYYWDGEQPVVALDGEIFAGNVYTLEAE